MHTLLTLTYFSYFVTIPLQWINFQADNGEHQISFPITFSNRCYSVLIGSNDSDTSNIYNIHPAGYTTSNFNYAFTFTTAKDALGIAIGK